MAPPANRQCAAVLAVEAWRRLKPRSGNKRFLAVLAGVAAWREREAQTRDVPRNRILKDEALLEIAAHPPPDAEHLGQIRAIPNGYANSRAGKALIGVVKEALLSSYEMACAETPLEGSTLVIEEVPVVVFCPECRALRTLSRLQAFACAECGTPAPDIRQGKELELVALEVES